MKSVIEMDESYNTSGNQTNSTQSTNQLRIGSSVKISEVSDLLTAAQMDDQIEVES